jgi:hypothetical protein
VSNMDCSLVGLTLDDIYRYHDIFSKTRSMKIKEETFSFRKTTFNIFPEGSYFLKIKIKKWKRKGEKQNMSYIFCDNKKKNHHGEREKEEREL